MRPLMQAFMALHDNKVNDGRQGACLCSIPYISATPNAAGFIRALALRFDVQPIRRQGSGDRWWPSCQIFR